MAAGGTIADALALVAAALPQSGLPLLIAAGFVAGLARGFSGFGAALIFIPIAAATVGPKAASPVLLVMDFVMTAGMVPPAFRLANRQEVGAMTLGALIGVPLGTLALAVADPVALRWAITAVAAALLVLLASGWRYHGAPVRPLTVAVGWIAGLFSGAAQLGGPPVVAYWLGGQNGAVTVRANVVLYFALSSILSGVSYLAGGLFSGPVFALTLVAAPLYAAGLYAGSRLFGHASDRTFRRICLALIAASAVLGMPLLDPLLR
ncbi:sulfite exporter TauE/SafE family protein [Rhizobium sp. TRM95111]|uniref:sulfite exporter TauE/SafE family protein n=1 Tax=Rhizobium alarense TaxID=2846851 RepID=UPI001F39D894|nr:sulfite exporter TauE/SafE family protein [Rhizobium alarense]MCF3639487.1 sulfite exporter TauE/SafE family protein [Rhizobium alarense]